MNSDEQINSKVLKKILEKLKEIDTKQIENKEILESICQTIKNISIKKIREIMEEFILDKNKEISSDLKRLSSQVEEISNEKKYNPYKPKPTEINIERQILNLNSKVVPLLEANSQLLGRVESILEVIKKRVS